MSSNSMVQACLVTYADNDSAALQCVASALETASGETNDRIESLAAGVDTFFLIFSAALMVLMQAGFAMLCAGTVRKKNVQNTMLKNFLDCCGAGIAFFICGYAFAYGGTNGVLLEEDLTTPSTISFIGTEHFFMIDIPNYSFWFYQFAFAATASTIVAGTLAERCQMTAYFYYSIMLSGFVFPLIARQVWTVRGFLNAFKPNDKVLDVGMVDFAGSGVIHVTGGLTALIASIILGPRRDRFHDEKGNLLETAKTIQGYSVSLQVLGTFLLWFGWYGFNPGSVQFISSKSLGDIAALCAVTTTLGGAFGGVSALFVDAMIQKRITGELTLDIANAMNGALSGLVAITGGCAVMEPWAAALVGALAGMLYLWSSQLLIRLRIDDAVDAIPVHFFNGAWGVIAPALFASPRHMEAVYGQTEHFGWVYEWREGDNHDARMLGSAFVGLLSISVFVVVVMTPFFLILNYLGWFRADALEEIVGLDVRYSGAADPTGEVLTLGHLTVLREHIGQRFDDDATKNDNINSEEEQADLEQDD